MSCVSLKEYLSRVTPLQKLSAALNTVALIACLSSAAALYSISTSFETTTAAQRFSGESDQRFAQLACYLPVGQEKSEEDIMSLRTALASKFIEQAMEAPEGGSLYIDAYSTRSRITASTDHATAEVDAFGVGGEFFHFHPLRLRSGTYLSERDLMDDLVVLDEVLAWRLFGGMDLTGLTLQINGSPFVVAGVVSMEQDFPTERTRKNDGTVFMSYSALERLHSETSISCYEIVLPDPISGYARSTLDSLLPNTEGATVENSSRFSLPHLWTVILNFGDRSMRTAAVIFPYWENALRLAEDYAALLLVLTVLTALLPLASLIILTIRGIRTLRDFILREIPLRITTAIEQRKELRLARMTQNTKEGE